MARYERDYGWNYEPREFSRRRPRYGGGTPFDAWPGRTGGESEGNWFDEGFEPRPRPSYDMPFRERGWGRGGWSGGGYGERYGGSYLGGTFRPSYGDEFRSRSTGYARGYDTGHRGTGLRYAEGWEEQRGSPEFGRPFGQRGRTRAADIMTADPYAVTPDTPLSEVAAKMRDLDVGIVPVIDNPKDRRLRGVITDRDITIRAVAEGRQASASVADCMTERVRSVNKNDSVYDVMRVMRQEQVRRVPVTDREGRLLGIIAQADLAVDYARDDREREAEVGEVLERVSEPAEPQYDAQGMAARRSGGSIDPSAGSSME